MASNGDPVMRSMRKTMAWTQRQIAALAKESLEARRTTAAIERQTNEIKRTNDEIRRTNDELRKSNDELKRRTDQLEKRTDQHVLILQEMLRQLRGLNSRVTRLERPRQSE